MPSSAVLGVLNPRDQGLVEALPFLAWLPWLRLCLSGTVSAGSSFTGIANRGEGAYRECVLPARCCL